MKKSSATLLGRSLQTILTTLVFSVQISVAETAETEQPSTGWIERDSSESSVLGRGYEIINSAIDEEPISLAFDNSDVREVIGTVFGDILSLNYAIDPNVRGQITLATAAPIRKSSVIPIIESVLAGLGLTIVREGDLLIVQNEALARKQSASPTLRLKKASGYQNLIVPLRFISAEEMYGLLTSVKPEQASIHRDPLRNLLVLSGTDQQIESLLETIRIFDVDQFQGYSFGLYRLQAVSPERIIEELEAVFGGDRSPTRDMVRLVPIERLNALMVVTVQKRYIDEIGKWISRLDKADTINGRSLHIYRAQHISARELADTLQDLLTPPALQNAEDQSDDEAQSTPWGAIKVVANDHNNSLLILASPSDYSSLLSTIRQIDVLPLQVLVEATIVEVTLSGRLSYGVQWFFENEIGGKDAEGSISLGLGLDSGFSYVVEEGATATLELLQTETNLNVVSTPSLMVLDNQTASIRVGDQVPVRTSETVNTGTVGDSPLVTSTIQFRDTGVLLEVTPRVNSGGVVVLEIVQEVNDVSKTSTSNIDSPTISQRRLSTSVAVNSTDTIILGGLIRNNDNDSNSGVPVLRNIPILGYAFKNRDKADSRTELLVFIRPVVVSDVKQARQVTEEIRNKMESIRKAELLPLSPLSSKAAAGTATN